MKYVFIAGGIGITPFRSMIRELILQKQQEAIVLFYSTAAPEDVLFQEVLSQAEEMIGLQVIYLHKERVTALLLQKILQDISEPIYYLSGPQAMVLAYQEMLLSLKIPGDHIKTDLFTGYD